jgi:5-methyltetrahydropteroyltriglutamate--homocysteine methyltransferase
MTESHGEFDFRTDLVGSLIRPSKLVAARAAFRAGTISASQKKAVEDDAIRKAVANVQRIGLPVVNDGELRRDSWMTNLSESVSGFAEDYPVFTITKPDGSAEDVVFHTKPVVSRLVRHERITRGEFDFVKPLVKGSIGKITLPSPAYFARFAFQDGVTDLAYADRAVLLLDITAIIADEMRALLADGVDYVQLDEGFTGWVNGSALEYYESQGKDPAEALTQDIAAENSCHDVLAHAAIRAIHICRGNRVSWAGGSGSYDWVAERLFSELHADRFLLEFDSERAGGFEPLRFVPSGKIAVLGLVTSKSAALESRDELLSRIERASVFCPLDRLALSAQCGFHHGDGDMTMSADDQWRKLELIVRVADEVWG